MVKGKDANPVKAASGEKLATLARFKKIKHLEEGFLPLVLLATLPTLPTFLRWQP
jgi:hypothetical protein